jgi:hypothetical protein
VSSVALIFGHPISVIASRVVATNGRHIHVSEPVDLAVLLRVGCRAAGILDPLPNPLKMIPFLLAFISCVEQKLRMLSQRVRDSTLIPVDS